MIDGVKDDSIEKIRSEFSVQSIKVRNTQSSFVFYLFFFYLFAMPFICNAFVLQNLQSQSPDESFKIKETYILIAVIALMSLLLGIIIYFYIHSTQRYMLLTRNQKMFNFLDLEAQLSFFPC